MRDIFGQRIRVGSTVTYPERKGSRMYMRKAVVTGVDETNRTILTRVSGSAREFPVTRTDRVVALPHIDSEDYFKNGWSR